MFIEELEEEIKKLKERIEELTDELCCADESFWHLNLKMICSEKQKLKEENKKLKSERDKWRGKYNRLKSEFNLLKNKIWTTQK